jgi:hypothetical protein
MKSTTLENIDIPSVKQAFPQIVPFPFAHGFGTNKSSKTNPKPLQHRFQKASPKLVENPHYISQILGSK